MTYRVIEDSIWDDPKVAALDSEAKLAFVYLVTNRQAHVSGIYVLPSVLAAHQTGLTPKHWDRVSDRVSELGLARFDHPREVVWVVNMMRYQGRGEKNASSAAKHILTLHKSPLIKDFCLHYPDVGALIPDTLCDTVSVQEQEQEQEQEQKKETDLSRSAAPKHDRAADVATVVSHYQSLHPRARPGTKEKAKIRARLTEGFTAEDICDGIDGCHATPHNAGDNDRGRQYLSLELIVRDASKLTQFIEGKERAGKLMLGDRLSKTSANMERWLQKDGDNGQAHIPDGHGEPRGDLREGAPGATARGVLADPREA